METKEKKQAVSAISKATNILVTVGVNPNVDELAALLGLSLILGKLDKHATAVFSGTIPPAISFLEPDKTFEDTVDGLRDFIIALNKDKADHLRYKLDGDVVKIFITPYKNTIIRDTDLEFSQGDFNVELILALGVENKADLDIAVASHGRILHDATTISLSVGNATSDLGEINWHGANASSLSEMLVSLARDLGDDLVDERIATALLTGIVSNTERFSNNLTTSDVMKTASSLMALGANQQLIAARLEEAEEKPEPAPVRQEDIELLTPIEVEDASIALDGSMQINHESPEPELELLPELPPLPAGPSIVDVERHKDQVLQDALDKVIPAATIDLEDLKAAVPEPVDAPAIVPEGHSRRFVAKATGYDDMDEPTMGGTLNATTEQAEEDSRSALEDERNRVILSHNAGASSKAPDVQPPSHEPEKTDEPEPAQEPKPEPKPAAPAPEAAPKAPSAEAAQPVIEDALATLGYPAGSHPTLADLDEKTGHDTAPAVLPPVVAEVEVDDARAAVANALDTAFNPANNPAVAVGSQPLGDDLHSQSQPPVTAPAPQPAPASTAIELPPLPPMPALPPLPPLPGQDGTAQPPLPPLPPLPDLSAVQSSVSSELDMHADEHAASGTDAKTPTAHDWQAHTVEPPAANDPNQFRIPGQS